MQLSKMQNFCYTVGIRGQKLKNKQALSFHGDIRVKK